MHGEFHPKQLHLVLIGGGHAQVQLLKSLAMKPINGLAITLISDVLNAPYSGMLPGFIEGQWSEDEIHIDLTRLASAAGADMIHARVKEIDADKNTLFIDGRPAITYDILSINSGAQPDLDNIEGAKEHAIAVKPIAHFIHKLPDVITSKQIINIIGAGVAGLELAFAFYAKYKSQDIEINVFSRSNRILPKMPAAVSRLITDIAEKKGIIFHQGVSIKEIKEDKLVSYNDITYPSGMDFVVTGVKAGTFIASLGKAIDDAGFVRITSTLQSDIYPNIFASGDVANMIGASREKAGVFAVRAGKILSQNVRKYIYGKPLIKWRPQKHYLALIGTGDGKAIAVRNGISFYGKWCWKLKSFIDKKFIETFTKLPEMLPSKTDMLPLFEARGHNVTDAIFADMRCSGCAAKASANLLEEAFKRACDTAHELGVNEAFIPRTDHLSEDSGLTKATNFDLRHSFDSLNQMISDPLLFARIAANHALSDLYVAGADPLYAQAHINLEEAYEDRQLDIATQMLTGIMIELADAKTKLVGGHTSQSKMASVGLAVTGAQKHSPASIDRKSEYVLLATKAIGTGISLAAHMRQKLNANAYNALLQTMLLSNQYAAQACFEAGAVAVTDITGFGLARHANNLLQRHTDDMAIRLHLTKLPVLQGVKEVIETGLRSSSSGNNEVSLQVATTPSAIKNWRYPLLFDPQTSGGVLAIVPKRKASELIEQINGNNSIHNASVIGTIDFDNIGIIVEE